MTDLSLDIARGLLWFLCLGVLFLPIRWAVFCFLLASNIDILDYSFVSSSTVGFENAIRIVGLPVLLLLRMKFLPLKQFQWKLPHRIWLAIVIYAGISGIWSDYRLSAAKMVIYLGTYLLLYAVFCCGWRAGWIDVELISLLAWSAIAIAAVQTFLLGNLWGTSEDRFTSFSTPQYFAAFLVSLLAILVFSGRRGLYHYLTCGTLIAAIWMSGSRYVLVSLVFLLSLAPLGFALRKGSRLNWIPLARRILMTLGTVALVLALVSVYFPSTRNDEFFGSLSGPSATLEDVGTLRWRLGVYEEIVTRVQQRSFGQFVLGSGTSSGAGLILDFDPREYTPDSVDGNRVLHSEFLRALYEWGLLGLVLLCSFLAATFVAYSRKIKRQHGGPALAFLGFFPSIIFGLAIENILAGAASAAGVGILLAISFAWETQGSRERAPALPTNFALENRSRSAET
jgi:hypothetical protein